MSKSSDYLIMIVGLIGTTITPWMQFYLQASIVEKGIGKKQYSLCRWDVIIGCIITDVVAFFIVLACAATLYVSGYRTSPMQPTLLWPCAPSRVSSRICCLRSDW